MTANTLITLVVLNSEQLDINTQVQHQFGTNGGTLGSLEKSEWRLSDRLGAVLPEHARIEMNDGNFCLCDLSGHSYINGALSPIGHGHKVQLSHGDELMIGPFRIGVYLGDLAQKQDADLLLDQGASNDLKGWFDEDKIRQPEVVAATTVADPLWVLQQEQSQSLLDAHHEKTPTSLSAPFLSLSAIEDTMDQKFVELPTINNRAAGDGARVNLDNTLLAPLMRGLGQTLEIEDAAHLCEMLEEMGKSLRAMVEGLLVLQGGQAVLADTHLRPIEDNPLRLGLDYANTLPLLFAESKSPVHLSAPAAVAEVLDNVRVHQQANQQAIAVALDSILQAFSPSALLNRFAHYRRCGGGTQENDGWAWQMYEHYYRELTSPRQQGFQKLFQQVYSQAYDRAVRQQREQQ